MKNMTLKHVIITSFLIAPFGLAQVSLADDANSKQESLSMANNIDSEFSAVISNRAAMSIEIIDSLRDEATAQGLTGWESELSSALNDTTDKAFLAAYNAKGNYKAVVSALEGINLDKKQLVNDFNAGGSPSFKLKGNNLQNLPLFNFARNLVYNAVTPCRIVSTHINAGVTKAFLAHGTGSALHAQGGDSHGCISNGNKDAYAYVFNITVHHTAAHGHIRIFPAFASSSVSSMVNFISGQAIANSSVVRTSHNTGKDFKIYAARDANVIVDVMGYFDVPHRREPDTYIVSTEKTIPTGSVRTVLSPECPAGYRLISGGAFLNRWRMDLNSSFAATSATGANVNVKRWRCDVKNYDTVPAKVRCKAYCLRIPGK